MTQSVKCQYVSMFRPHLALDTLSHILTPSISWSRVDKDYMRVL
jgi:hypothetical protein